MYQNTGDLKLAAHHYVLAGSAKQAYDLGLAARDDYLDMTRYLGTPTYWTEAAVLRLLAAQAALHPTSTSLPSLSTL